MVTSLLIENIKEFIDRIGVVLEEQIYQMFCAGGESNHDTVQW